MTTRKSQIRKDNVGRILLAAEKIFALKGYVGASMVDGPDFLTETGKVCGKNRR